MPSDTMNLSIRPGTLPDTRTSVASACPCNMNGSGFKTIHPTKLTTAITKSRVKNAISIPECLLLIVFIILKIMGLMKNIIYVSIYILLDI
jgi:hypothetical protein